VNAVTLDIDGNEPLPAAKRPDDERRMPWSEASALKPLRGIGAFFSLALDIIVTMFKPPFAWRELLDQTVFIARVSIVPALMLSVPYVVITVFIFNVLLNEIGAADLSGTGAAFGAVNQIGPLLTVLVIAGAGASAMCADLGARTIREELDALRVMGIDPVQALLVPRVLATTIISFLLLALVTITGLTAGFLFSVFFQHVTPGSFVAGMTLITGVGNVLVSMAKATLFGLTAGLIACYQGISVTRGPAGVGNAVNEAVVFSFVFLFIINVIVTAIGIEVL
jgi:phospholipid/cholesterol/gamma-HCH transport system permease protein